MAHPAIRPLPQAAETITTVCLIQAAAPVGEVATVVDRPVAVVMVVMVVDYNKHVWKET